MNTRDWQKLQWQIGKLLAGIKKITHPDVRVAVILRNERTGDQFVGGEIAMRDMPAFLRRATEKLETPATYEDYSAIRISTGEPLKKGSS